MVCMNCKFSTLRELNKNPDRDLSWYRAFGTEILRIARRERRSESAVVREVIAKVFNGKRKPANLLAMTRFARRFTAKDVAKLADVGWKQMNALLSIKSDEVLFELAAEVNYNRLTTKELKKEINRRTRGAGSTDKTYPRVKPEKALELMEAACGDAIGKLDMYVNRLPENYRGQPMSSLNHNVVARLSELAAAAEATREKFLRLSGQNVHAPVNKPR